MKSNIFIPKTIKVGFQKREDTYTKKLAYVIYYDQKGTLRKETSWQSWRDKTIPDLDFDNIPTSGFVLNKKAGGYSTGWNHRQTYCRVYDGRDFEFEITIPNLLYILENTNSIKGKGLEGEFVYGWDGSDLLLIPTSSPDYKEISQYNEIVHANNYIKTKDLILGATYKTKNNEEWIYMGRFDYWDTEYLCYENGYRNYSETKNINKGKHYYFAQERRYSWSDKPYFKPFKNLGEKFISIVSSECVENYVYLFDKLECNSDYSPIDETKTKYIPYTFEEFYKLKTTGWYSKHNLYGKELYISPIYNNPEKYYFQDSNISYNSIKVEGTLEEIFDKLKPMHKDQYLTNGKFYGRIN